MGTQHLVLRSGPLERMSGEVASEGVSDHLRLGQGYPVALWHLAWTRGDGREFWALIGRRELWQVR